MTDVEKQNEYNATHYLPWGDNEYVEFLYEEDFEDWLEHADSKRGKKRTRKSVKTTIESAKRYFNAMELLTEGNVNLFKQKLIDNSVAPTSINRILVALKVFVKYLANKYNAPQLVQFKIATVVIQQKQYIDDVISRADYEFLINQAKTDYKHPNTYLACKIMGTTGVRRCELLQVKVEHIKHGYLDVIGKGGKQRRIYFPKNAREELSEYLSHLEGGDSGYVIRRWGKTKKSEFGQATRDNGSLREQLIFERAINTELSRAGERYGISPELMHPHGFRHFFAKEFLKHRLDISLLADLLGHSSLEITRIYLKMTSREQADVVNDVVTW